MSLRTIALVSSIALLSGCPSNGPEANEAHGAGAGGTGDAGLGGTSGEAGASGAQADAGSMPSAGIGGAGGRDAGEGFDAGADEPSTAERAAADHAALLACGALEPCTATSAYLVENQGGAPIRSDYECLFAALAMRTPGLYRHDTSHAFGNGSWQAEHALLVQDDGSARYVLASTGSYGLPPDWEPIPIEGSLPGARCTLKPASFFEGCLDAMTLAASGSDPDASRSAWACAFGGGGDAPSSVPWLEACEAASPLECPDVEPTPGERAAADEAALLACAAPEPCAPTSISWNDGGGASPLSPDDGYDCVMNALGARTPGLYRHVRATSDAAGYSNSTMTVLVREDGSALFTRVDAGSNLQGLVSGGTPAQRCSLKAPSYYQGCLDAIVSSFMPDAELEVEAQARECTFGGSTSEDSPMQWVEGCEAVSPVACE